MAHVRFHFVLPNDAQMSGRIWKLRRDPIFGILRNVTEGPCAEIPNFRGDMSSTFFWEVWKTVRAVTLCGVVVILLGSRYRKRRLIFLIFYSGGGCRILRVLGEPWYPLFLRIRPFVCGFERGIS